MICTPITLLAVNNWEWRLHFLPTSSVVSTPKSLGLRAPKKVILVTLDTFRVDHLPTHGYPVNTASFLSQLAKYGTLFQNSHRAAATTSLAHASLFTSQHVFQHGVRQHKDNWKLRKYRTLLPHFFRSKGYHTIAVPSTHKQFFPGLTNAFDRVEFVDVRDETYQDMHYQTGKITIALAINALKQLDPSKRVFIWVHLFDPHTPYQYDRLGKTAKSGVRRVLHGSEEA